jgi:regulation of enolase protein 1 (concanavalin A-like superfamily)
MAANYAAVHLEHPIPDTSGPFQLTSPPGTDVWDKPPSTHSFNAPIIYQTSTVGELKTAKVTVSAQWKDRYDQGGLVLVVKTPDMTRWVKTGIEFEYGIPNISTVAKDQWSDWSLRPLLAESTNKATIELEVVSDGSLWVWLVGSDGKKHALREVTWYASLDKSVEIWVGVYVAKPAPNGEKDDLTVDFDGLAIATQ